MYKELIGINTDGSYTYSSDEGIINSRTICTPNGIVEVQKVSGLTGIIKVTEDTREFTNFATGTTYKNRKVYDREGRLDYSSTISVDKDGKESESDIRLNLFPYNKPF